MVLENVLNLIALTVRIVALLSCLFFYIERPRKGWLYLATNFLLYLLSDYYWTVYTLVMGKNPDISALIAYLGWNLGLMVMWLTLRAMQPEEVKKFFHPLMLLPIPLNIAQLLLYNTFGGVFNNIIQVFFSTAAVIESLRGIIYYLKNKKNARIPYFHIACFCYMICEYGMWTSSCFDWPSELLYPYNYFVIMSICLAALFPRIMEKSYGDKRRSVYELSSSEIRTQLVLQIVFSVIVLGSCLGGYVLAVWMRNKLAMAGIQDTENGAFGVIAITLFAISVFLTLMVLTFMVMVAMRHKSSSEKDASESHDKKKGFNFIFILIVTFALLIFALVYTSGLFYKVSVSENYESCEDKAAACAAELENYINGSSSVLWVIANTVDSMVIHGSSQEEIRNYIVEQTNYQKYQFDENFTGVYGYVRGEYMDGLNWVPPQGYDATQRDWYKYALEADGDLFIVPPYIDAQTNTMIVTFCKMLSDGSNVVALDVKVNHIQDIVREINVNDKGYGLLMDEQGTIIAHHDAALAGKKCSEVYGEGFYDAVLTGVSGGSDISLEDGEQMLFVKELLGHWYMIVMITRTELMAEVKSQLLVNALVFLVLFLLMTLFYYLGYRNEQAYAKTMEELKINKQKQEYDTRMLKLEKAAADEANKAKSNFLADMSHEIRTPINAMLGMNEMILRESHEREIIGYSANIKTAGDNLLQLVNTILDFSKIEDGKMEIVPVNYSTESMITYLIGAISQRARAKGLEFLTVIDPTLPSALYGDDMRLTQVTVNLLTNAVKYTPEGSVTLTVKAGERRDNEQQLYIEVKDTGIGIKEENIPHLFDSFERFDVKKNRNIEGTGLGMSIVTKLLDLMGGSLKVESTYGSGSVFSFEIYQKIVDDTPLGDINMRLSQYAAGDVAGAYKESFHAPNAHILVVDDIALNLTVIKNLLKKTELNIDTASGGEEALTLTAKKEYDLIFLDQRMPGMNGIDTLKFIRSQEGGKNLQTPVICLTADAIAGAREKYLSLGFSDYLIKPIDTYELERKLFRFLPEEKIEIFKEMQESDEESVPEAPDSDVDFSILRSAGFDVDTAMEYFLEDPDIYRTILDEYLTAAPEKNQKLSEYYTSKDWKNYAIVAHSIKSTSKNVGAMELSELAAGMESAADKCDEAYISSHHDRLCELYLEAVETINKQLGKSAETDASAGSQDVFEFSPEE